MAALSVVDLARALVDVDSTTGREAEACAFLAADLRERGFRVTEQPLGGGRSNVVALLDERPEVVLSTHVDCVPPFFPSRVEGGRLYGRGACDAKGALAAQVAATCRLRDSGEGRVGLLFVVGEERGSDGAKAANAIAPGCRFLVDGEPTGSRLGLATRGVLRVTLRAKGRAAHSSQPQRGVSAIDRLVDALVELRGLPLPEDPGLGRTFYVTGLVSGGIAPNVVSPSAEAELNFRTVGPGTDVVRLRTVPGFDAEAFAFTTDIPFLDRWGEPLLFGPGSILDAHTDEDHVRIEELEAAVLAYEQIARALLAEGGSAAAGRISR